MNIAFGKIGKAMKLRGSSYSPVGGDNEATAVLQALANNNPNKTFYIVGRSDFCDLSEHEIYDLFPYDNVIDIWQLFRGKVMMDSEGRRHQSEEFYNHIINYFRDNNIKIDYGVLLVGQLQYIAMEGLSRLLKEPYDHGLLLEMTKVYATPIARWLNYDKPRWMQIIHDPRYMFSQWRDQLNFPEHSLSQYNDTIVFKHIKSLGDSPEEQFPLVEASYDIEYAEMETAFCVGREYPDLKKLSKEKTVPMGIVLNEGNPSRYKMLKEWILSWNKDIEIYGKWEHPETKDDSRFVGSVHLEKLQQKLRHIKYTFIIPIAPGWVTSKYVEMIHNGIIPFFHPSYDEQGHCNVPSFLRVESPEELRYKITQLENDYTWYQTLISDLQYALDPKWYNGKTINHNIMIKIDPMYRPPNLDDYEKKTVNTLESFFG